MFCSNVITYITKLKSVNGDFEASFYCIPLHTHYSSNKLGLKGVVIAWPC